MKLSFNSFVNQISEPIDNRFWVNALCKSLYAFLFFKLVFLFPTIPDLVAFYPFQFNSLLDVILYAPLKLFEIDQILFLTIFSIVILTGLLVKLNYISAFIIFWFSFSLSRLTSPINNGSDSVLNLFLLIAILLPVHPKLAKIRWQVQVSNAAIILGQISLALIYLQSGYNKLTSLAWPSGAAVHSITHLTFFQNPFLNLELSELQYVIISWLIISFELGFSILIWFKKFRIPLLIMGVIFHLGIVFFLGLADFGIVMILCYAVFLPVTQTATLRHEASLQS